MFVVVFCIILGLIGVIGLATAVLGFKLEPGARAVGAVAGVAALLLGGVLLLASMYTSVGPSDVAVVTSYGHTEGDIGPGLHWLAPWKSTITWDHSVQTVNYGRETDQTKPGHCIQVRIGGQQTICLAAKFQYQVQRNAVDRLFIQYRTQGNMQAQLVDASFDQGLQQVLQNFSPIEAMAACAKNGTLDHCPRQSLVPYATQVRQLMQADLGTDIHVVRVLLIYPIFDRGTTDRLNSFQTQIADTQIAVQAEQTATAQAAAYKTLHRQLDQANSANIVASQCFTNVMEPLVKAGNIPAGINCWPGSGSGSTVVVPAR